MVYKLKETVDKQSLNILLDNPDQYDLGSIYVSGRRRESGIRTLLMDYYNSLNEEGEVVITYKQKSKIGRHWPDQICLTTMCKAIRHTIGKMYHIDLDVKNCHPILLEQLCSRHGIQVPDVLVEYNTNRDQYIDLKDRIIEVINGSAITEDDNPMVCMMSREAMRVSTEMIPHFNLIYNRIKKKTDTNIMGAFMANVLQNEEN